MSTVRIIKYIVLRSDDQSVAIEAQEVQVTDSRVLTFYNDCRIIVGFNADEWRAFKIEGIVVDIDANAN